MGPHSSEQGNFAADAAQRDGASKLPLQWGLTLPSKETVAKMSTTRYNLHPFLLQWGLTLPSKETGSTGRWSRARCIDQLQWGLTLPSKETCALRTGTMTIDVPMLQWGLTLPSKETGTH